VTIIEVNPRICGQFADLYQKVDGRSTYVTALELAAGMDARWEPRRGAHPFAASVPLRLFQPMRALEVPTPERIASIERAWPGTCIWNEIAAGADCSDFGFEDGVSLRYGVINLAAATRAELADNAQAIHEALGYRFTAL
jgi:hypothetical protein